MKTLKNYFLNEIEFGQLMALIHTIGMSMVLVVGFGFYKYTNIALTVSILPALILSVIYCVKKKKWIVIAQMVLSALIIIATVVTCVEELYFLFSGTLIMDISYIVMLYVEFENEHRGF